MIDRFNTLIKETYFAPAERLGKEEVKTQSNKIAESEFLDSILTKIPFVFLILNHQRQILYSNEILIESLGYKDLKDILGLRPGEMLRCINAEDEAGGCGTSKSCRYCGAVQAILESQKKKNLVIKECRLTIRLNNQEIAQDFEVGSKPFNWSGETFYIITLNDISSKKRREHLERVFFHDLTNKAGSLSGLIDLIREQGQNGDSTNLLELVSRGMKELLKDIDYQKQLQEAEDGKLKISEQSLNSMETIYNLRGDFRSTLERQKKHIKIDQNSDDINIKTDMVLLNRVLTNMIKNALEASRQDETVTLGFRKKDDHHVMFMVSNPAVMTEKVRLQVFQRSFSTKGKGRGIGTYSIKLFTESYLKGKAEFESVNGKGTTFIITLPLNL